MLHTLSLTVVCCYCSWVVSKSMVLHNQKRIFIDMICYPNAYFMLIGPTEIVISGKHVF